MVIGFVKGFIKELGQWAGAVTAICAMLYAGWLLGAPIITRFVEGVIDQRKLATVEQMSYLREDIDEIVADRKVMMQRRQQQFDLVTGQLTELTIKIEGVNQRLSVQMDALTTLVTRINDRLDALHNRLPAAANPTAAKLQDRIAPQP